MVVDGVEKYNIGLNEDGLWLFLFVVDIYGYINVVMMVVKLFGFDLCL